LPVGVSSNLLYLKLFSTTYIHPVSERLHQFHPAVLILVFPFFIFPLIFCTWKFLPYDLHERPSVNENKVMWKIPIRRTSSRTLPVEWLIILTLTFWCRIFFLSLAHPVYKIWIMQEPNTLELWNKLHFEEEKTESIYHV
jgi:hypothetical protein